MWKQSTKQLNECEAWVMKCVDDGSTVKVQIIEEEGRNMSKHPDQTLNMKLQHQTLNIAF